MSVFFEVWICDYYLLVVCRVTQTQWAVLFYILFFFWLGYGSPSYLLIGNCGHFIEFASPLSLSPLLLTHNLILLSKTLHTSPSTKTWLCGWTVSCIVQSLGQIWKGETIFISLILLYNWLFYSLFILGYLSVQNYNSVFLLNWHIAWWQGRMYHRKLPRTVHAKCIMKMETCLSGTQYIFPLDFPSFLCFSLCQFFRVFNGAW